MPMKSFTKEDYIYFSLLTASVVLALATIIYRIFLIDIIPIPTCPFYQYLGLYCPGCGGTRAFWALSSGDILKSIYYHPILMYFIVMVGLYLFFQTLDRLRRKKKYTFPFSNMIVYAGIILLLANWIFRNILLVFFHIAI